MKSRKLKIGLGVAVVILLVAAGTVASSLRGVAVETAEVTAGELAVTVRGTGEVKAQDPLSIAAEVGGRVAVVNVEEGDRVAAGDLLVAFDTAPLEDGLARAIAERRALEAQVAEAREQNRVAVELAELALKQAETELKRIEYLHAHEAVSDSELEAAQLAYEKAAGEAEQARAGKLTVDTLEAQVQAADAMVRQAERELARARITATRDGVVLTRAVDPGAVVTPGTPLISIGDPEALTIDARIEPRDAALVKTGQTVRITHLTGGVAVAGGEVTKVAPTGVTTVSALGVKEAKAAVEIRITEGVEHLKSGYEVSIEIVVDQTAADAIVPESAVFRKAGQSLVFVVRDGRAHAVEVALGRATGGLVEVTGEIRTGDLVIIDPPPEVGDGTRVSIK